MILEGEGGISKWGTKGTQGVGGHGSAGQPAPDRCGTARHVSASRPTFEIADSQRGDFGRG